MIEFSNFIADKWNISQLLADKICDRFARGDTYLYLLDYHPEIFAVLDSRQLSDIFDCLSEIEALAPKKKRVSNALDKAGVLDDIMVKRIKYSISSDELDDMLMPYRSNARSRGQMAVAKGLSPLADIINEQEIEDGTIEELFAEYVGKDKTLKCVDDVIVGVKDILAERYAHDETVRSMVREVGYEDGFFEVLPRTKKDIKKYAAYKGRFISVAEIESEEFLKLSLAEQKKEIRFKHGVQLFQLTELLRHHFIVNPDAIGFDLICEVIDDAWSRLLQPMVEKVVKDNVASTSEEWALSQIEKDLDDVVQPTASIMAVCQYNPKQLVIVAVSPHGDLLGATHEKLHGTGKPFSSNRIKQFCNRYRPSKIIVEKNDFSEFAQAIVERTMRDLSAQILVENVAVAGDRHGFLKSDWVKEKCAMLDNDMVSVYAMLLHHMRPIKMIIEIGIDYFTIHEFQKYVRPTRLKAMFNRTIMEDSLRRGVLPIDAPDSLFQNLMRLDTKILPNIRKYQTKTSFTCKNDLLHVDGMTEVTFRNIAGYIIISGADSILDRTLVHPDHFSLVSTLSQELSVSLETLVSHPTTVSQHEDEDYNIKSFIDRKLSQQLAVAQRFPSVGGHGAKFKSRARLNELKDGVVLPGRVTNITKFGVFVDINAVCDGLVHISQLADGYIESAEQVVREGDNVDVRVLGVDMKKRRISLSMKKISSNQMRIRPSEGQLSNLADHFKKR